MSYAERIHLKRLKRKRLLAQRVKSWGNIFNFRKQYKPMPRTSKLPSFVLPTPSNKQKVPFFKRLFNRMKPAV